MKAEELMHNDLTLLNGKIVRFNTYCGFVRLEDGAQFPRSIQVQPIPLTQEILKKHGFEYEDETFWVFKKNWHDKILIRYCEEQDEYMSETALEYYRNHWIVDENYRIDFVHELQHALRLCGLNELANNFKV